MAPDPRRFSLFLPPGTRRVELEVSARSSGPAAIRATRIDPRRPRQPTVAAPDARGLREAALVSALKLRHLAGLSRSQKLDLRREIAARRASPGINWSAPRRTLAASALDERLEATRRARAAAAQGRVSLALQRRETRDLRLGLDQLAASLAHAAAQRERFARGWLRVTALTRLLRLARKLARKLAAAKARREAPPMLLFTALKLRLAVRKQFQRMEAEKKVEGMMVEALRVIRLNMALVNFKKCSIKAVYLVRKFVVCFREFKGALEINFRVALSEFTKEKRPLGDPEPLFKAFCQTRQTRNVYMATPAVFELQSVQQIKDYLELMYP